VYALHPAVIHFPIALLVVNLALTFRHLRRPDPFLERAAYGALMLGWWGAAAGVVSGLIAAARAWPVDAGVLTWLNAHAVLGFVLLYVYGQALLRRRRDPRVLEGPRRRGYLSLLIAGALLLLLDGWIGGHMVYRLGVGVEP
jgi:uncharacterized membrane protein